MRLEQLLYHENLQVRLEELLYHENQGTWMIGAVGQTCSVRGPRAMYSFYY